jgi:hypothetical protein
MARNFTLKRARLFPKFSVFGLRAEIARGVGGARVPRFSNLNKR